ncbi:HD domain-containing phosphohydrolase [Desulfovibrio inopinatus]|uniref:HD domain-containing phosphohydrolase n=1 Tax=Desulfovibrio inopinatus TaxID=102109 RepID=UPI000416CB98|nr:HD domain-containing phosphohydrolase [Desulfovibrio inopinatus]
MHDQPNVLLVDDTKTNISLLVEALKDDYKLGVATSGHTALKYLQNRTPDLILLDIMMPGMDGFEVCKQIKTEERLEDVPVIFITAMDNAVDKTKGFALGGVDYITKPFDITEVKARVRTHVSLRRARITLKAQNDILEERVRQRTQELHDTQIEVLHRLSMAAEYRDTDTGHHVKRISGTCALLGEACGLPLEECDTLYHASSMHDIGKIGIPDNILLKPGRLTGDEWNIMKQHTTIGARMLTGGQSELLKMAEIIAISHHERFDGKGYPHGLQGGSIPLVGRITCLCDVFDALCSKRPYKEAWPIERAVEEIIHGAGTMFDPDLVREFQVLLPRLLEVRARYADSEGYEDNLAMFA